MKPVVRILLVLSSLTGWLAGCGTEEPECKNNADCKELYLCNPEGKCIQGKPVQLLQAELPKGIIDDGGYRYLLPVQDGLQPFRWSLKIDSGVDILDWIEVAPGAGEVRAIPGKAPTKMGIGTIIITVTDSSNGGEGLSSQMTYDVSVVECIQDRVCHETLDQRCQVGIRQCTQEGRLEEDCMIDGFSDQLEHCGPACEACPSQKASACIEGACKCGVIDACGNSETCCAGGCIDLNSSLQHCGFCGNTCDPDAMHATGIQCKSGACDYEICLSDFLNCDGNTQNGCETKRDAHNCHRCSDDCADTLVYVHTKNQQCTSNQCSYECVENYADCSKESAGCETLLGTKNNCSTCKDQCNTVEKPACISKGAAEYVCGCVNNSDCDDDRLCCDGVCLKRTEFNCTFCGHACSILDGGYTCKKDPVDGWQCGCYDTENHTDCRGPFEFSNAECNPSTNNCICPGTSACTGDLDDMCCFTGNSNTCSNLYEDFEHCGACRRTCASGQVCTNGACGCSTAGSVCPNLSGTGWQEAWSCESGQCICPVYQKACPIGQYCCEGVGCCLSNCRDAQETECSTACIQKGQIWCGWGCCERCETVDDC